MDWVCPICNGIASYIVKCLHCGNQMEARGAVEDYFDSYSPYLDKTITQKTNEVQYNRCVHIFYCPNCNEDKKIVINEIQM